MTRFLLLMAAVANPVGCGGQITTDSIDEPTVESESEVTDDNGDATPGTSDSDDAGTDQEGTDDTGFADAESGDEDTSVEEDGAVTPEAGSDVANFQTGMLTDGTAVTLRNVIVTSTMSVEAPGFFVQDVGGGEWSGVFVFTPGVETEAGNPEPAALTVDIGDVLNLTGTSYEYYEQTQLVVESMSDVERIGTGASVDVTELTAPPTDWEPYEGVLVRLSDVSIASVPDSTEAEHEPVTDWGLSVADKMMDISVSEGASYSSITGILTYSWNLFRIAPRSESDLAE